MAATRRLKKELHDLKELQLKNFKILVADEDKILTWIGLILPDKPPYNKGAFKIEINFPIDYPFRPPKLFFHTKIYHPNITEQGFVCLPIVMTDTWRPATTIIQVINAVIALLNDPEPYYVIRPEVAQELLEDRRKFLITAERHTIKNALPRPAVQAQQQPQQQTQQPPQQQTEEEAKNQTEEQAKEESEEQPKKQVEEQPQEQPKQEPKK